MQTINMINNHAEYHNLQTINWRRFANQVEDRLFGEPQQVWSNNFNPAVQLHIMDYVILQYGHNDVLAKLEPASAIISCTTAIAKYKTRQGRNQRPSNDGRDCVKRAHYAQLRALYRGCELDCDFDDAIEAFNDWLAIGNK